MRYQSLIINTQRKNLTILELSEIISKNLGENLTIDYCNSLIIQSESNSIGIKEVGQINYWAYQKSNNVKFIIIYESEKLTEEAQNSLLKIVEETPENSIIIFITDNTGVLINTIISRCRILNFENEIIYDENIKELAQNFMLSNYLERLTIIDKFSNDEENGRQSINIFILELIRQLFANLLNNKLNRLQESYIIEQIDNLKIIYKGIKQGTNIKLTLNYVNTILTNI